MYPLYQEIRELLGTPLWIDEGGFPRYCDFHPDIACRIYGDWVALLEVECQACRKVFKCATSVGLRERFVDGKIIENTAPVIIPMLASWGDAPWHDNDGCECGFDSQCSGTTMTTVIRSIRVWFRDRGCVGGGYEFQGWGEVSEPELYADGQIFPNGWDEWDERMESGGKYEEPLKSKMLKQSELRIAELEGILACGGVALEQPKPRERPTLSGYLLDGIEKRGDGHNA